MEDNIIQFPGSTKSIIENKNDEMNMHMFTVKSNHINETLELIVPMIFNNIEMAGFNVIGKDYDDLNIKNGALVVESIRSILCDYHDIYHPFQDIANSVFTKTGETYGISEGLNITFKTANQDGVK